MSSAGGCVSPGPDVRPAVEGVTIAELALGSEGAALQAASSANSERDAVTRIITVSVRPRRVKPRAELRAKLGCAV
jgi:hypothetical protein